MSANDLYSEISSILDNIRNAELDVIRDFSGEKGTSILQGVLNINVYSYPSSGPRRGEAGGLKDKGKMISVQSYGVGEVSFSMRDYAPPQHPMSSSLDTFIEGGFRGVPPRPFYEDAEKRIANEIEKTLQEKLDIL